jgi:hypothetical protein
LGGDPLFSGRNEKWLLSQPEPGSTSIAPELMGRSLRAHPELAPARLQRLDERKVAAQIDHALIVYSHLIAAP